MKTIVKALMAAAVLAAAGSAMAQTKLKWAHVYETSEPFHKYSVWAGEEIKKRTNGRYEIQVFDSYGKKEIGPGDLGSIYSVAVAKENAAKAPGEWQTLDVVFKAPRFEGDKKTANAMFVLVKLNGKTIHENVDVPNSTGGALAGGEKPKGPLMFQGDHGIVAFRNIRVKEIAIR